MLPSHLLQLIEIYLLHNDIDIINNSIDRFVMVRPLRLPRHIPYFLRTLLFPHFPSCPSYNLAALFVRF
jgi:hypothetical protein